MLATFHFKTSSFNNHWNVHLNSNHLYDNAIKEMLRNSGFNNNKKGLLFPLFILLQLKTWSGILVVFFHSMKFFLYPLICYSINTLLSASKWFFLDIFWKWWLGCWFSIGNVSQNNTYISFLFFLLMARGKLRINMLT